MSSVSLDAPGSFWEGRGGKLLLLLARLAVGGIFLYAAFPKLMDPAEFARAIDNYHMLPAGGPELVAILLPPLEVVLALALLLGVQARGAALITAGMLAAFAVAMGQAMARGIDLSCGCFGAETQAPVSIWSILRNLALIAACLLVVIKGAGWRLPLGSPPQGSPKELRPPDPEP